MELLWRPSMTPFFAPSPQVSACRPDELAHALGMPVLDVLHRLARFEADGTAQCLPDGR
jgi:hypothetical protein